MAPGDSYRVKAADMSARARRETNRLLRSEFENLARSYLRLAEQAERNAQIDIVYEAGVRPNGGPPAESDPGARP